MNNGLRQSPPSQHPAVHAVGTVFKLVLALVVLAIGLAILNQLDPGWLASL